MEPGRNRKYQQIITNTEIETVIEKFPTDESPGTIAFTGKFYQTFEKS